MLAHGGMHQRAQVTADLRGNSVGTVESLGHVISLFALLLFKNTAGLRMQTGR